MKKVQTRILAIMLALIMVLPFILAGCSADLSTQEIINKSIAANEKMKSYKFDLNMNLQMNGLAASIPGGINIVAKGNGAIDTLNSQMQMNLNLEADIPGQGKQTIPMEYIWVGGWTYMKVSVPIIGDQWLKVKMNDTALASQDQAAQQLEFLKSAVTVTKSGTESIDGKEYYVLQIEPDLNKMADWFNSIGQSLGSGLQQFNLGDLDVTKLIKQISIKEWVAKDNYVISRAEVSMMMTLNPSDMGIPNQNGEQINFNITESLNFFDYSKPITVTLPSDAQNAQEVNLPD